MTDLFWGVPSRRRAAAAWLISWGKHMRAVRGHAHGTQLEPKPLASAMRTDAAAAAVASNARALLVVVNQQARRIRQLEEAGAALWADFSRAEMLASYGN